MNNTKPLLHRSIEDAIHLLQGRYDHSLAVAQSAVFEGDGLSGLLLLVGLPLGSAAVLIDHRLATLTSLIAWLSWAAFLVRVRRSGEAKDGRPPFHLPPRSDT